VNARPSVSSDRAGEPTHTTGHSTTHSTTHPASELLVHEALRGRGRVSAGGRVLTEVDYRLKDVEEVQRPSPGVPGYFPHGEAGVRAVYGAVTTPKARALDAYVGTRLVLALEGGRTLDFTVTKVMEPRIYLVQGLGGFQ
jgi:hypothetical protein